MSRGIQFIFFIDAAFALWIRFLPRPTRVRHERGKQNAASVLPRMNFLLALVDTDGSLYYSLYYLTGHSPFVLHDTHNLAAFVVESSLDFRET